MGTTTVKDERLRFHAAHVAQLFAQGAGLNVRYLPGGAEVNFGREADTPTSDQSRFYPITGVEMIHPYWDFALLRVQGVEGAPLGLSTVPPETLDGSEVVVVGYPARDFRTDLDVQDRIFAGIFRGHPE